MTTLTLKKIAEIEALLAKCEPGPVEWEGIEIKPIPEDEREDGRDDKFVWVPEASVLGASGIQTGHNDFENAGNEHLLLQEARNALPELLRLARRLETIVSYAERAADESDGPHLREIVRIARES